tara:strand:+ start:140 stop:1681 length:1542 start_codon:yes stop_codon:yes gene_type:complete
MTVTIENLYTGNGSTTDYSFTFPYLDTTDIKASLGGVVTTAYSLLNATTVRFNSAPGNSVAIRIYRETAYTNPKATFYPGSAIRAGDLNDNTLQNLYVTQEANDKVNQAWLTGDPTVVSSETWYTTDDTKIASTKAIENRIGDKIDTAMEADVLAGTDLAKTASGGQVTINHSVGGANATVNNSNGTVLQDITISAQGHVTAIGSYDLDNRYYTESEVDSNFYKLGSANEIQSTETWSAANNKIATTAAIDARITDLIEEVGGFVPLANETSFPAANPDINNGTGTLISIKEISSTRTPSGGTVTIANGAGSGNTVTITGCGSTELTAGYGVLLETTTTLHTYTFHRLTPKATEVTTVATNVAPHMTNVNTVANNINSVNSFSDVYRIASSDPTSHLTTGDLAFNTTTNELRVYNGSAWQGGVTATGNLVSKADIGASSGVPGTGSSGQYLQTNGSGTLSWQTISEVVTETDQTIASSLTITTGKNAMSVGDVTLASGVILTIPANSKYILIS